MADGPGKPIANWLRRARQSQHTPNGQPWTYDRLFEERRQQANAARLQVGRTVAIVVVGAMVVYGAMRLWLILTAGDLALGLDYRFVMGQAERIRAGGAFYQTWELTSPILPGQWADLYPPSTVVLLFLPMSFLPAAIWWVVPLTVIVGVLIHHRPSVYGWAVIAVLFVAWPHTWTAIQLGNTIMWIAAAVALGTVWGWPSAFVLLKPTLAPLALIGIRHRWWWVVCLGLSLTLFLPWWGEYLTVLHNMRGFDASYSAHDFAFVLIPVVGWVSGPKELQRRGRVPLISGLRSAQSASHLWLRSIGSTSGQLPSRDAPPTVRER